MEPEADVERQVAISLIDLREGPDPRAGAGRSGGPLDQLVNALLRAVSMSDVAAAVVAYGTAAVGARWARVVLLDHTGAPAVSLLGGQAVRSCRLDDGLEARCPWTDAVREGAVLEFSSAAEALRAYPRMDETHPLPSEGAVATVPLAPSGRACGALTFGFDELGPLTGSVRDTVARVATVTAYAAQRAVVYDAEYRAAEMLQQVYLPDRVPDVSEVSFASRSLSASEPWGVAGDWYDVISLPEARVGMVMGDVAGHGIQAATTMAALRGAVRAFSTVDDSPAAIVTRMNRYLEVFKPDAFATLFVAIFDPADGRLCFARAGHPPALLVRPDGSCDLVGEPLGPPLGLPDTTYDESQLPFPPGSTLVIYTDGFIERSDHGIDVSIANLVRTASSHRGAPPEDVCDRLVELLAGAELNDDATLLVARRDHGPHARRRPS